MTRPLPSALPHQGQLGGFRLAVLLLLLALAAGLGWQAVLGLTTPSQETNPWAGAAHPNGDLLTGAEFPRWYSLPFTGTLTLTATTATTPTPTPSATGSPTPTPAVEIWVSDPVVYPPVTDCLTSYWITFTNSLSQTTYVTLNTDDPDTSTNWGVWQPDLPQRGFYTVEAFIAAHEPIVWCSGRAIPDDTHDARYTIQHALGETTVSRDQAPLSDQWLSLGEYVFDAGTTGLVLLTDLNAEEAYTSTVSFSALRFRFTRPAPDAVALPLVAKADSPASQTPTPTATPTLPVGVIISHQHFFDKCNIPSLGDLQVWWEASPYRGVNMYIGGISRSCPNTALTPEWVAAARQMGWELIPTWAGLQAPGFKHPMDEDPAVSYLQGRGEADAAYAIAAGLGLVSDGGTIIYLDIEAYGETEYRPTVSAFVNGWVERLHELGSRAGAYGSCGSYVRDWATISNPPDDVWLAHWISDGYDPDATVWGAACVSDALWNNNQRLRQYAGQHDEAWGGRSLEIDSNIAGGEVLGPPAGGFGEGGGEPVQSSPGRHDMGWLSAQQGWVWVDQGLWWTEDGGQAWRPAALPPGRVLDVFFLDRSTGWVLTLRVLETRRAWTAWRSADGGLTWQAYPLPALDLEIGQASLGWLDDQHGWAALRPATSSNTSRGVLLKTDDGGVSWQMLPLPIGGTVQFSTSSQGWVFGGASGGELWFTLDGGLSWLAPKSLPVSPPGAALELWLAWKASRPEVSRLPGYTVEAQFVSGQVGWAISAAGVCQGFKQDCAIETTLWRTLDGGLSWLEAPMP